MSSEKLLLGTVQMGLPYGVNNKSGRLTYAESKKILFQAHSSGIRTLDSAEAYGDAHTIIGRFHKENPGKRFEVITKLSVVNNPEQMRFKVLKFLTKLRLDSIYALMFHSYKEYESFKSCGTIVTELKEAGIINKFGVSAYTNEEVKSLITDPMVDLIQLPFNLLDNEYQRGELLKKASALGKIIHTRSAFLQGLFFMGSYSEHPVARALKETLEQIRQISERAMLPISSLAMGYCLSKPYIDRVLIGVDTEQQLKENITACKSVISDDLISEIDNIQISNKDLLNPSLWNRIQF